MCPAILFMKELSVFIDESGDFGNFEPHCRYYIVSFVFHDQAVDISSQVSVLDQKLDNLNIDHVVHTGPILRREPPYNHLQIQERKRILNAFVAFLRHVDVSYVCFLVDKKYINDPMKLISDLSRQISQFLQQHTSFFHSFNVVKVYYDNGQTELTKILASVLPIYLNNVVFNKVSPKDYKLFQAADYVCTFRLLKEKLDKDCLTKSDLKFFSGKRELKKTYLAPLLTKTFL